MSIKSQHSSVARAQEAPRTRNSQTIGSSASIPSNQEVPWTPALQVVLENAEFCSKNILPVLGTQGASATLEASSFSQLALGQPGICTWAAKEADIPQQSDPTADVHVDNVVLPDGVIGVLTGVPIASLQVNGEQFTIFATDQCLCKFLAAAQPQSRQQVQQLHSEPVQPQTLSDATTATIAKSQTADFPNEPVAGPSRDCRLRHSEEKVLVEEALSRKATVMLETNPTIEAMIKSRFTNTRTAISLENRQRRLGQSLSRIGRLVKAFSSQKTHSEVKETGVEYERSFTTTVKTNDKLAIEAFRRIAFVKLKSDPKLDALAASVFGFERVNNPSVKLKNGGVKAASKKTYVTRAFTKRHLLKRESASESVPSSEWGQEESLHKRLRPSTRAQSRK